jgi:hypothetical protein
VTENTPNPGVIAINGAFSFDNVFMINGVDIVDNLFAQPQNLFIEDAIQETQILSSGISAEFGRFSGGVVNAVTKSGGNRFQGSYRLNFRNPAWTTETPFEVSRGTTNPDTLQHTRRRPLADPSCATGSGFSGRAVSPASKRHVPSRRPAFNSCRRTRTAVVS